MDVIKNVFLFNRVSLATEICDDYERYRSQHPADEEDPLLAMAQNALEDPEGRELPLLIVDENGSDDFLIQLRDRLKRDHTVIHMPDLQVFLEKILEKPFLGYECLLIGNLQEVECMDKSIAVQRHLHRLLARGYRIVLTSSLPLEELDIDDRLKEIISNGLTITVEEDM